jgi:hypothetical protein
MTLRPRSTMHKSTQVQLNSVCAHDEQSTAITQASPGGKWDPEYVGMASCGDPAIRVPYATGSEQLWTANGLEGGNVAIADTKDWIIGIDILHTDRAVFGT